MDVDERGMRVGTRAWATNALLGFTVLPHHKNPGSDKDDGSRVGTRACATSVFLKRCRFLRAPVVDTAMHAGGIHARRDGGGSSRRRSRRDYEPRARGRLDSGTRLMRQKNIPLLFIFLQIECGLLILNLMRYFCIMLKPSLLILLFLSACSFPVLAQEGTNDKKDDKEGKARGHRMWNLDVLAGVDLPMADLAKRFGTSYRIGVGVKHKLPSNWIFGAKFEFITGNKMKEDSLLYNMRTSPGGIIGQSGEVFNVGMFQRGYITGIQVGRIFPFAQANPDSGPMMLASFGFMQYKIKFFDRDNSFPQLRDEYEKGYDRLTNGLYLSDFIGYNYHSKSKLINLYAGVEFLWGFTKVRRDFILDLGHAETAARNDLMLGFKLGWVVPIYRKKAEETYY